ncbi:MAG TPA: hypothetical protein VGZ00_04295 [Candidatus Baltobacteraceae bacterium]|jgi:TPR repeat protein|nr:hypothetical protein [Candidatus Baltobacteraceae bacterium]
MSGSTTPNPFEQSKEDLSRNLTTAKTRLAKLETLVTPLLLEHGHARGTMGGAIETPDYDPNSWDNIDHLRAAATEGDPKAQFALFRRMLPENPIYANEMLKAAADNMHPVAQYVYGVLRHQDDGSEYLANSAKQECLIGKYYYTSLILGASDQSENQKPARQFQLKLAESYYDIIVKTAHTNSILHKLACDSYNELHLKERFGFGQKSVKYAIDKLLAPADIHTEIHGVQILLPLSKINRRQTFSDAQYSHISKDVGKAKHLFLDIVKDDRNAPGDDWYTGRALNNLGYIAELDGHTSEAFEYYKQGTEEHNGAATYNLARFTKLEKGGASRDLAEARRLFDLAEKRGFSQKAKIIALTSAPPDIQEDASRNGNRAIINVTPPPPADFSVPAKPQDTQIPLINVVPQTAFDEEGIQASFKHEADFSSEEVDVRFDKVETPVEQAPQFHTYSEASDEITAAVLWHDYNKLQSATNPNIELIELYENAFRGDNVAQVALADHYFPDEGSVRNNTPVAVYLLRLAAEGGDQYAHEQFRKIHEDSVSYVSEISRYFQELSAQQRDASVSEEPLTHQEDAAIPIRFKITK